MTVDRLTRHFHRGLMLSAASVAGLCASSHALTDLGAGFLAIEVEADLAYDSNIFTNADELSDTIATLRPAVFYIQDRGIIHFTGEVAVEIARFMDYTDDNYEDFVVGGMLSGPHRPDASSSFDLSAFWREVSQPNEEAGRRIESEVAEINGSAKFDISEKTGLRVGGGYAQENYVSDSYSDHEDMNARVDLMWYYSAKLQTYAGYRYRDISYEFEGRDDKTDTVIIGATGTLSPKVTGTVEVGVEDRDRSGSGLYYMLDLEWAASDKTTWSLTGSRDATPSITGDDATSTSLTAAVNHEFTDKWSGNASFGLGKFDRGGIDPRSDDFIRAGLGVNLAMSDTLGLFARFSYEDRSSNSAFSDYSRTIAAFGGRVLF